MSDEQPKIPAVGRFVYIAPTTLTSRHSGEVCVNAADYDTAIQRIAKLEADLQAMTEDRNLWRDEHEGDCPVVSERDAAREQLAIAERALLNQFVCAEDPKNLSGLAILEAAEQSKAEKERAQ